MMDQSGDNAKYRDHAVPTSERPPSFKLSFSSNAWDVIFVLDYDNDLECADKLSDEMSQQRLQKFAKAAQISFAE